MKKLVYIAAALMITLVSCKKNNVDVTPAGEDSNLPAWVLDESLPVPILFNSGDLVQTKSGLITDADFTDASFLYGVTALDLVSPEVRLFQTTDNHVEAKNVTNADLAADNYMAQFVKDGNEITYYYPLQSKNNFTFFGYRTNEDDNFALEWSENNAYVNNVVIGHQDLLWAKGEASALTPNPGENVYGFNAKYVRTAWTYENNVASAFYANWAPKLHFNHITTAFQFVVKTDPGRGYDPNDSSTDDKKDDAAKKFVEADIYVTELLVSGMHASANLCVTAGSVDITAIDPTLLLTASGDVADITVQNITNPTLPWAPAAPVASGDYFFPQYNDGNGNEYGEPLLVLPSAVEEAAGNTDNPKATIKFHVPNQDTTEDIELELKKPTGGFLAGKKYIFTILVHSPEEIEVVTSLAAWETANDYTDGNLEIE